jgi:hypothetical protein
MFLGVKLVPVPGEAELPFESPAVVVQPYGESNPVRRFSLPGQVEEAAPGEYGFPK